MSFGSDLQDIKCVSVGDNIAKKTEFLIRYTTKNYDPSAYITTVFENHAITTMVNGNPYNIEFVDTSGQEDYDHLRPLSYSQTDIFLVFFSVGHPYSLDKAITKYIPEIRKYCPNTPYILVGTRTDLRSGMSADAEDFTGDSAGGFPSEFGPCITNIIGAVLYKECSCLSEEGVNGVIDSAISAALNRKKGILIQASLSSYQVEMSSEWKTAAASAWKLFSTFESDETFVILKRAILSSNIPLQENTLRFSSVNDFLKTKNLQRLALVASTDRNDSFIRLLFASGFRVSMPAEWKRRYQVWNRHQENIVDTETVVTIKKFELKELNALVIWPNAAEVLQLESTLPIERLNTLILVDCPAVPSYIQASAMMSKSIQSGTVLNLRSLVIVNCNLDGVPLSVSLLPNLTLLTLAKTYLKELPSDLVHLKSLEILCIRDNKLQQLPTLLSDLKKLRVLNCDNNDLKELPSDIGYLVSLEALTVCNNKIRELPLSLGLLTKSLHTLHWSGNLIKLPLQSTATTTEILGYLRSLMDETVPNSQVKLTFVGQEGAGKTTLVEAIGFKKDWRRYSVSNQDKTDGVEISDIELHNYQLKIFDLAGDVEYLRTHMLFLSEKNLFVTVFDMSQYLVGNSCRSSDQLGRLELWLETIQSHAPGSHAVIAGTHADHSMLSEEMKQVVRQQVCLMLAKYRPNHLLAYKDDFFDTCLICNDSLLPKTELGSSQQQAAIEPEPDTLTYCIPHIVGYYEVGSKEQYPKKIMTSENSSVQNLKEGLIKSIKVLLRQNCCIEISRKWAMMRDNLQQMVESNLKMQREPVVDFEEIQKFAVNHNISLWDVPVMVNFFHCQGDLLWYDSIPELEGSVIIEPKWLSVMLRKVISFRPEVEFICDGVLRHKHFAEVWCDISNETRIGLLSLLRRAGLCFKLSRTDEMFPCCLPVGWPDTDIWPSVPSDSELQLTYNFVFTFLPPSFFSDVTVEIHKRKRLSYPSNVKPVYYRFHVVFLTKTRGTCSNHKEADRIADAKTLSEPKCSSFTDLHRAYLEVTPHNNTVKVVVRGSQPCCVMSEIQEIISDVHPRRHKGISYSEYIVCPQCELNHVKNPARFESKSISEPFCPRGHELGGRKDILTGNACKPSQTTTPELARIGRTVGETLEDHNCPKLFVVLPIQTDSMSLKDRLVYTYLRDGFAVHLLCECPGQWHFIDSPGFRISKPKEFFEKHGSRVCKMLKVISAFQRPMNAAATLDPHFRIGAGIADQASSLATDLDSLLQNYLDKYPELKSSCNDLLENDLKDLKTSTKLQRSELARFLNVASKGREFGPLVCTYSERSREWLWLCRDHNPHFEIVNR